MNNIEVAQLLLHRLRLSSIAYIETQHNAGRAADSMLTSRESLAFNHGGERVNEVRARHTGYVSAQAHTDIMRTREGAWADRCLCAQAMASRPSRRSSST